MNTNTEKETLKELREIQKNTDNWKNNIGRVASLLSECESVNVRAKALWILGEMGLRYPQEVKVHVAEIAGYLDDDHPKLRERALNALGRIGRADMNPVLPYFERLFEMADDREGNVRLSFVWACENMANNAPEIFCEKMDLFFELIGDSNERVRIEAPEMFRVMGKRMPKCVRPYLERLDYISKHDEHPVVRVHCQGAVRVTNNAFKNS